MCIVYLGIIGSICKISKVKVSIFLGGEEVLLVVVM